METKKGNIDLDRGLFFQQKSGMTFDSFFGMARVSVLFRIIESDSFFFDFS